MLTNQQYDRLKQLALIATPLLALIANILKIWNVPYMEELTSTLIAVNVFLGSLVTILKSIYEKNNGDEDENIQG